jgi:hypothetical protein
MTGEQLLKQLQKKSRFLTYVILKTEKMEYSYRHAIKAQL